MTREGAVSFGVQSSNKKIVNLTTFIIFTQFLRTD